MSNIYRSPYEAYPFLADGKEDLRCDFEILTDKICSGTGLLCAMIRESSHLELVEPLTKLGELIYHANPTLRTFCSITREEVLWLKEEIDILRSKFSGEGFVLPAGCKEACVAHILRTEGKELVRLLYRHLYNDNTVSEILIDFCNLLSGYFFTLSLYINYLFNVNEIPFISRNYK